MDDQERDALRSEIERLDAEIDALRLLVMTLIGRMAIDDAGQIESVAHMVEVAGDAMHLAGSTTVRHLSVAREIDIMSRLMRQVISVSRH